MGTCSEPVTTQPAREPSSPTPWFTIGCLFLITAVLVVIYAPLLLWLGYAGVKIEQLSTSGVLVLFALFFSIRSALRRAAFAPAIRLAGLLMLLVSFGTLALAPHLKLARFPLVLVSFCVSFAAVVSFLFGRQGVRCFLPALGAIVVFGIMAVMFPGLDWPLRTLSGQYAAGFLDWLGFPVKLAVNTQGAPELLMLVPQRVFVVATECNGFGLLVSSIMLVTILVFQWRVPLPNAVGLYLLAVPIAVLSNMLRIVSIVIIAPRLPVNYDLLHETLGLIFYYAALISIWMLAEMRRQPEPSTTQPEPHPQPEKVELAS